MLSVHASTVQWCESCTWACSSSLLSPPQALCTFGRQYEPADANSGPSGRLQLADNMLHATSVRASSQHSMSLRATSLPYSDPMRHQTSGGSTIAAAENGRREQHADQGGEGEDGKGDEEEEWADGDAASEGGESGAGWFRAREVREANSAQV